jgi:hypothetical protein
MAAVLNFYFTPKPTIMTKPTPNSSWTACMALLLSIVFSGSNYAQVLPTFTTDLATNSSQLATANNTLKSLSSTTISPQDLQTIDSLILNEGTVLRNKFYLLAGWLNRKAALQAVPYEYRRNLRDQNDYDMAMIRLGDQSRIKRLNKLLASVQVDDNFVYTLLPKLIYTRRPEVIDFIFDQVLLDRKNCSVADPLRNFFRGQWNNAMGNTGGNTDLAIDLFDDMMSSFGPNLKQELLTRSVQSNTRVNTLFSEVNINSLID